MTRYRLHYFPESGNSYKLALMLTFCGQGFETVWTDFGRGVTFTPAWRQAVNSMGEIPVLEVDGVAQTQTAPILIGLAERYGRFGGTSEEERAEILRWLFWDNQKLSGHMATYRFMRAFNFAPEPILLAYFKRRCDDFLGILSQRLQARPFLIGDHPTIADLSACAYLSFPKHEAGYDFAADYPDIEAWLQRIATLPNWYAPYDLLPGKRMQCFMEEDAGSDF